MSHSRSTYRSMIRARIPKGAFSGSITIITLFDLSSSHVILQSSVLNIKAKVLPMGPAYLFASASSSFAAFGTWKIISVSVSFPQNKTRLHIQLLCWQSFCLSFLLMHRFVSKTYGFLIFQ